MRSRARSPALVGRDIELDRLMSALDSAQTDGAATVVVAGEAGVGKTRLVRELSARAVDQGWRVCVGRCIDGGEAIWPLAPLREIVLGLVEELDQDVLDLVVASAHGVLAGLVPELGDQGPDDGPVSSDRLCQAVVGLVSRLARRSRLVVVFEDLHWADASTQRVLAALTRTVRRGPLLLIGTLRSDELHRRHPLRPMLAEIERADGCERIDLEPLDATATAELAANLVGYRLGRHEESSLYRRSAGNPFLVEELLAAGAVGLADGLPSTLRDVTLARIADLDDVALHVLGVAAAAGATYAEVIADACGLQPPEFRMILAELFATGLLRNDGDDVRFRHELSREVFYDELLPGERADVHSRLAASLERRRPDRLGEIAWHWSAAHDARRALVASIAAGRQSLASGAAAEAEVHFSRALELWSSVDDVAALAEVDHPGLLAEAAVAAEHARHYDRAIELNLRVVAELAESEPIRQAAIWLQLRDLYRFLRRWDDCALAVSRALALIPATPPSGMRAEALANAALGELFARRPSAALRVARQAVAAAEAADDPNMIVKSYDVLIHALQAMGDHSEAVAIGRVNLTRCDSAVSPERTVSAYNALTAAMTDAGLWQEIPEYAERAVEFARRTGLAGERAVWLAERWIEALVVLGRWAEAEHLVGELTEFLEQSATLSPLVGTWAVALVRQGRRVEARPLIEATRAALNEGSLEDVALHAAAVVMFDAAEGRHEEAAALVDAAADDPNIGDGGNTYLVATGIAALADVAAADVRREIATQRDVARATKWLQWSDRTEHVGRPPTIEQVLFRQQAHAELQRLGGRSTPEAWAAVVSGWERQGFPYHEAAARLRLAEALLAGTTGRSAAPRRAATTELGVAREMAEKLGAAPLLSEIDDLARRARLPMTTAPPDSAPAEDHVIPHALNLTPREAEVLIRLGLGRSNGQIATELFISTKTASVHVSNILRKLGVTNRVEAGAIARRLRTVRPADSTE